MAEVGGKGLFTKEIEEALLNVQIDVAIHSTKDMTTKLPKGTVIGAIMPREDPRDAYISLHTSHPRELKPGNVVGTAGLRRQAQMLAFCPGITVAPLRGNVETRLKKIEEGQVHATLPALAGLKRLRMEHRAACILDYDVMLPAVAQGALCLQIREGDERVAGLVGRVNDAASLAEITAERAMLAVLDGSCRAPIAGLARAKNGNLVLEGLVAKADGSQVIRRKIDGRMSDAEKLGIELGMMLQKMRT